MHNSSSLGLSSGALKGGSSPHDSTPEVSWGLTQRDGRVLCACPTCRVPLMVCWDPPTAFPGSCGSGSPTFTCARRRAGLGKPTARLPESHAPVRPSPTHECPREASRDVLACRCRCWSIMPGPAWSARSDTRRTARPWAVLPTRSLPQPPQVLSPDRGMMLSTRHLEAAVRPQEKLSVKHRTEEIVRLSPLQVGRFLFVRR